jgi:hypothetical protein
LKKRFRDHFDILNNPNMDDPMEVDYYNNELQSEADKVQGQYARQPKLYNALLSELAKRGLSTLPQQKVIDKGDDSADLL